MTQWVSHIVRSMLTSYMKVIKIGLKHILGTFWGFLMTMIWDVKIDLIMCEPHCVMFFFMNLVNNQTVWYFDNQHIIGILLKYLLNQVNVFRKYHQQIYVASEYIHCKCLESGHTWFLAHFHPHAQYASINSFLLKIWEIDLVYIFAN